MYVDTPVQFYDVTVLTKDKFYWHLLPVIEFYKRFVFLLYCMTSSVLILLTLILVLSICSINTTYKPVIKLSGSRWPNYSVSARSTLFLCWNVFLLLQSPQITDFDLWPLTSDLWPAVAGGRRFPSVVCRYSCCYYVKYDTPLTHKMSCTDDGCATRVKTPNWTYFCKTVKLLLLL